MSDLAEFKEGPKEKPKGFPALLEAYKPQIAAALPRHMNADRMARIALTCYRMTPKLGECDPLSIFAAVIQAAQLGLEPGLNGRCYIIPYGTQATFVPGWKGLVELTNRSGRASVWTSAVFEGDAFDWELGSSPFVKHKPGGEDDPKKITHFYAIGRVKGADMPVIEVWTQGKVERHRDRFNKVGKRHYSFDHAEMYGRKVVLLQVLKYLPSTPELEAAIILNDSAEIGGQNLTVKDAIEGTFTIDPPPAASDAGSQASTATPSGPQTAQLGGGFDVEQAYAAADDAIKARDWDLASDLARNLPDAKKKMILDRIPKK